MASFPARRQAIKDAAHRVRHGSIAFRRAIDTTPTRRLVYAATKRCPCGLGLAHDTKADATGYWDCSGILLGTADRTVQHTAKLPFVFYEIKSEDQPSANGATTRP